MSHLTQEQRYTLATMLQAGFSRKNIAGVIGKDKSVISREIARNCDKRSSIYKDYLAQKKYQQRQKDKSRKQTFICSIQKYVEQKLQQKYSPEQIAGLAKKEGIACVSHERIYQHVWADKRRNNGTLYEHLRTQGKRYRKRGSAKDSRGIIKDRVDISQRPPVVETRERMGDLEIDTITGKNHQGAIVTINDRATGMLKMKKLESKDAVQLAVATVDLLQDWKSHIQTITADNGKEFAAHKTISEALEIDFYFARPYHSWERGSNENLNGLIRQYIPKKTNFSTITDEYVQYVENELNNRPRKRFNFETPNKIFENNKVAFVT